MKKLLIILILFSLHIVSGCKKSEELSPPVTFTINIVYGGTGKGKVIADKLSGIPLGGSVTLTVTPDPNYSLYSIKVGGVLANIIPTDKEYKHKISGINTSQTVEVTFEETDVLILSVKSTSEKPWMWTKLSLYKSDGDVFIGYSNLTPEEKTNKYYFVYPSMDALVYQADGGIRSGKWSLKQKTWQHGNDMVPVLELTSNRFVWKAFPIWSQYDNCYIYAQYIFERI